MKRQKAMFELKDMAGVAVVLVVAAVVIAFGQKVLSDVKTTVACDTAGYVYNATGGNCYLSSNASITQNLGASFNASQKGQEGLSKFSDYLPTVAIVLVAALLIGILMRAFMNRV